MNFGQGMNTLQSEFYQKLVVAAGLDDSSFQLLSPAISVASSEDLWQQQNQVPHQNNHNTMADMEKVCLLPQPDLRIFNNFRRISNK